MRILPRMTCRFMRRPLAGLLAIAAGGCAVGPDFQAPAPPAVPSYTAGPMPATTAGAPGAGGAVQRFDNDANVPAQWWTLFQSPTLDRLVQEALARNPALEQAEATLRQAQEDFNAKRGATMLPSVDGNLSAVRQKVDPTAFGIPNVPATGPFTLYNASVSVSYTLDLFGGNRRALEALRAQVDYRRFELEAARLTLAGNVVAAAIRHASLHEQITTTQTLLAMQEQQLAIDEARWRAGGIAELDVQNQRTLVAQTRATLPPLLRRLAQLEHQLAVYLGHPPADTVATPLRLEELQLPDTLPLSLPSSLARRRPDIMAAEALLHQANADVGVATADLYPRFTLSGNLGSDRTRTADLADGLNVWNIGLKLMQPIFHGGELRAKKRSAVAAYDAANAAYRQTVLQGLQQVADALRALQTDADRLNAAADADERAQTAARITARQYQLGGVSQSSMLDAQGRQLQTSLDRIQARADRYTDTVALFQALGGGWQSH